MHILFQVCNTLPQATGHTIPLVIFIWSFLVCNKLEKGLQDRRSEHMRTLCFERRWLDPYPCSTQVDHLLEIALILQFSMVTLSIHELLTGNTLGCFIPFLLVEQH